MKNKPVLFLFLLAVTIDLISYNRDYIPFGITLYPPTLFFIFFNHNIDIRDAIYFLGESISWSIFILSFMILSKEYFHLNVVASAYFGLCLNNVWDELMNNNIVAYAEEYYFLWFAIGLVLYKIHVHSHPQHKAGILFYRIREYLILKMFAYLSR